MAGFMALALGGCQSEKAKNADDLPPLFPTGAAPEMAHRQAQVKLPPEPVITELLDGQQKKTGKATLVLQDQRESIDNALAVLKQLDKAQPQLLVEARVVELTVDEDLEVELKEVLSLINSSGSFLQTSSVELKTPGANPAEGQGMNLNIRPWAQNGQRVDSAIRLLQSRGKAAILSSPNLVVAPGTESSIITGEEVPIQNTTVVSGSLSTSTVFKRVGIRLRVNLLQISGSSARLEINPEVSTVTGYTQVSQGISNPVISLRNVSSTLTLQDGQVLTIGGLLSNEDRQVTRGLPWVEDLPWVGELFKSRRHQKVKTQLIFFLRVHILPESSVHELQLHRPGAGFEFLEPPPATRPAGEPATRPEKQP